jgi:hypothetical protein
MSRFPKPVAVLAAGLFLIGLSAVTKAPIAGATSQAINTSCALIPNDQIDGVPLGNGETFTVTVTGNDCWSVRLDNPNNETGTLTINGNPWSYTPGQSNISAGDVIVFTAPSSGQGFEVVLFNQFVSPAGNYHVAWGYPPSSGVLTDNNDGSMSFAFSGLPTYDPARPDGQGLSLFLVDPQSVCPSSTPLMTLLGLNGYAIDRASSSPQVITVGTSATSLPNFNPVSMAAGDYEACLYQSPSTAFTQPQTVNLIQSMPITLGSGGGGTTTTTAPTPTTTTTVAGPGSGSGSGAGSSSGSGSGSNGNGAEAGSPSGDAVAPAFTG